MLVLEATSQHQGEHEGDYHWCTDGELVYRQADMGCRTPDCGCERGWAGFDSHRATTTVKVVDRVGFTVADLAHELAVSLHDGGWLDCADPSDHVVAEIVTEIIEFANHFPQHAVLGRDGDLISVRNHQDVERLVPFTSEQLDALVDVVKTRHPIKVLEWAALLLSASGTNGAHVRQRLQAAGWFETSVISKSIDWLATQTAPESLLDPDTPKWLLDLDLGTIRAARYRHEGPNTRYLIEVKLPHGPVGTFVLTVDAAGRLSSAGCHGGPINKRLELKLLATDEFGQFRPLSPTIAQRTLQSASDEFDIAPSEEGLSGAWPANRPLIDFVLDRFSAVAG